MTLTTLPERLAADLDGEHLGDGPTHAAYVLASSRPSGAIHLSLLSRGELVAVSARRLLLAVHSHTTTAENLRLSGEATLLAVDPGRTTTLQCEVADARPLRITGVDLTAFDARVSEVREHSADYAEVTSGITFRPHHSGEVRTRWVATVRALRQEYVVA